MRILVVEDEARIRAFLARAFEAEGFVVDVAPDGEQGLERALVGHLRRRDPRPAAARDRTAWRFCASSSCATTTSPVLILSARSDIATKLRGFELGAVDYIVKPFSLDELLARLRLHMRRAGGFTSGDGGVLRVGVLALDLTRRQARMGDTVADLADREFRLLHFLMLHPGEVISRQRLLSEVWGFDFDPRSNVVDVCVRRLRRQLGPDAPIETVRNAGYRAAA